MSVSQGLQNYFDGIKKSRKGKRDAAQKLKSIEAQIDTKFLASFGEFKQRILGIVEENPEAESLIVEELSMLDTKIINTNRRHNLKKAAALIEGMHSS